MRKKKEGDAGFSLLVWLARIKRINGKKKETRISYYVELNTFQPVESGERVYCKYFLATFAL